MYGNCACNIVCLAAFPVYVLACSFPKLGTMKVRIKLQHFNVYLYAMREFNPREFGILYEANFK